MWPKAISQLVELAPHVSRLLPLADRFLKDKAAGETATQQAMDATQKAMDQHRQSLETMASGLRGDVSQMMVLHAGLQKQLVELDKHLSSTRSDALAAKVAAESVEARLSRIETRQNRLHALLIVLVVISAACLVLLVIVYVHTH